MESTTAKPSQRLVEIDLFRGLALLVIFWDHLHWFVGSGIPLRYGFSDAAAVFIFLSGYVSGLVYGKVYQLHGIRAVVKKAARRGAQIYLAHLLALTALLVFAAVTPATPPPNPVHIFYHALLANPVAVLWQTVTLQYFPELFDILPLYVVLILVVPPILVGLKRQWYLVPITTFLLYATALFIPVLNFQQHFPSWSLNPFSWLFLFGMGITIAVKGREGVLHIPRRWWYLAGAMALLVYAFVDLVSVNQVLQEAGILTKAAAFLFPSPFPLIQKPLLEPMFLAHFICLAYAVAWFTPHLRPLYHSRLARPFAVCGQHSLTLFSVGIVITYVFAYMIISLELSGGYFYLLAILGCTATVLLASFLSYRRGLTANVGGEPQEGRRNEFLAGDGVTRKDAG